MKGRGDGLTMMGRESGVQQKDDSEPCQKQGDHPESQERDQRRQTKAHDATRARNAMPVQHLYRISYQRKDEKTQARSEQQVSSNSVTLLLQLPVAACAAGCCWRVCLSRKLLLTPAAFADCSSRLQSHTAHSSRDSAALSAATEAACVLLYYCMY